MSRIRVAVAVAVALLGLAAPGARAHGDSRFEGDCGFTSVHQEDLSAPDEWTGYVAAHVVLYSERHGTPVSADVSCVLSVDGVEQQRFSASGTGVVAFADAIRYTAGEYSWITMCIVVDYTSDETPTQEDCGYGDPMFPPQWVIDLIDYVFDIVNEAIIGHVDPAVCAALPALGPGVPGLVEIDATGDVRLFGEPFWDCPPYDDFPPPEPGPRPVLGVEGPTGVGYATDNAGVLTLLSGETTQVSILPPPTATLSAVSATCLYVVDRASGTVAVAGTARAAGADSAYVTCELLDAATGEVVYEGGATGAAGQAFLHDTVPAPATALTVCTTGGGTWGAREVTVGRHCRSAAAT
jgi:hypothetical protein